MYDCDSSIHISSSIGISQISHPTNPTIQKHTPTNPTNHNYIKYHLSSISGSYIKLFLFYTNNMTSSLIFNQLYHFLSAAAAESNDGDTKLIEINIRTRPNAFYEPDAFNNA